MNKGRSLQKKVMVKSKVTMSNALTAQMRLAINTAKEAKIFTQAVNAWIVVLSDRGKQPRLANAPKKVQAPLAIDEQGLLCWLVNKKAAAIWLPKGKGKFLLANKIGRPAKLSKVNLKEKLDRDIIWMGDYKSNQSLIFLPLDLGSACVHILVLEKNIWSTKDLAALTVFSRLSSHAFEIALENRKLEKRLRRSYAVAEIAQNINTTLDIEILLRLIVLEVTKTLNCQAGNIWLKTEKQERLVLRASLGLNNSVKEVLEENITTCKGWEKKDSICIEHIKTEKDHRSKILLNSSFQTLFTVPLKTKNRVIGVIQLFAKTIHEFTKDENALLRTLVNLAATAIDNTRLFKESQRKARELLAVYEMGQVVSEISNIDAALKHIVERVSEVLDVEKSWLMFYQEKSKQLYAHPVAIGAVEEQLEALVVDEDDESVSAGVYRSSRPMFSNDAKDVPAVQNEFFGIFDLRNIMAVPMRGRDETIGVFLAANKRQGALFTGSDVRLFKTLASAAATVIQHAKLYSKLKQSNLSMVKVISKMIDAREPYTRGHSERVAWYSGIIAKHMHLSSTEIEQIRMAGLLHDIGKSGVGEKMKFSTLNRSHMKPHVLIGEQMIRDVDFPWEVKTLVKHHHEHVDGSGCPDGLQGEEIPIGARIIAVANSFDTGLHLQDGHRHSTEEGFIRLRNQSGKELDSKIVQVFTEIWPLIKDEKME